MTDLFRFTQSHCRGSGKEQTNYRCRMICSKKDWRYNTRSNRETSGRVCDGTRNSLVRGDTCGYALDERPFWLTAGIVGTESIATGECILVKHDETADPKIDTASQWKAKVLEVRALDPEHVYIRLSWLNRPEDLDSGRKEYHGKNELVPTNQMDIIDAMAVNGGLHVKHWDEMADDDEASMPEEEQYFWRQTFDFANTKTFSVRHSTMTHHATSTNTFSQSLRKICIDDAPQNPDELIVQCSNGDCRKWMHVRCIAEKALQRARKHNSLTRRNSPSDHYLPVDDQAAPKRSSKPQKKKGKLKNAANNPNLTAVAIASKGLLTAEVFVKGHPDRPRVEPAEEDEIIITTEDREQYSEDVCCLFCETEVD